MRQYKSIFKEAPTSACLGLTQDDLGDMLNLLQDLNLNNSEIEEYLLEAIWEDDPGQARKCEIVEFDEDYTINLYSDRIVLVFEKVITDTRGFGQEELENLRIIRYFKDKNWKLAY